MLPVEVQNRIVWMQWTLEHRETFKPVMNELRKLPICIKADWVAHPKTKRQFRTENRGSWCFACHEHNCDLHTPACRWCALYEDEHASLELQLYEIELQRKRNAISTYNSAAYDRFVREHIQSYYDLHQFTLTQVMIPMLGWTDAGNWQFDSRRVRDNESTFTSIVMGSQVLLEYFMQRNNRHTFRNPRTVAEEYHEEKRRRRLLTDWLAKQKAKESQESLKDI